MPERMTGVVAKWLNHRGFGFITPDGQDSEIGKDIIVRFQQLKQETEDGFKSLAEGSKVEFEIEEDEKNPGKKLAVNVTGENGADCEVQVRRARKAKEPKAEGEESEEAEAKDGEKKKGSGKRRGGRKGRGKKGKKGEKAEEKEAAPEKEEN